MTKPGDVAFDRMVVGANCGVCVVVDGQPGTQLVRAGEVDVGQRAWLSRVEGLTYVNQISRYLGLRLP